MARRSIDDLRNNPNMDQLHIREAAKRLGYPIEGYYLPLEGGNSAPHFEVVICLPGGKRGAIWRMDCGDHNRPSSPTNWRAFQNRLAVLKKLGIPGCQVWPGTIDEIQVQLELWMLTKDREPIHLAPLKNPFDRYKERTGRHQLNRVKNRGGFRRG